MKIKNICCNRISFKFLLVQAVMDWNEMGMCSGYRKFCETQI